MSENDRLDAQILALLLQMTPEQKRKALAFVKAMPESHDNMNEEAPVSVRSADRGKVEQSLTDAVSASSIQKN